MASLERDFDAVPELAALVADLEGELARLRAAAAAGCCCAIRDMTAAQVSWLEP